MVLDTFSETSLLSISRKDGTDRSFQILIETIETSGGEKGFESLSTIAGGRLKKFNPQEDVEVSMEGYAVEVGTDDGATGLGFYDLIHSADTSQPLSIPVDRIRDEFRLVIMATDNPDQTSASAVTTSTDKAMRWTFQNGHFSNAEASFSDKVWKFTITFKCPPFNKSGTANVTYESTDGTADKVLPALGEYAT